MPNNVKSLFDCSKSWATRTGQIPWVDRERNNSGYFGCWHSMQKLYVHLPLLCSQPALRLRCPSATNRNHPVQLECRIVCINFRRNIFTKTMQNTYSCHPFYIDRKFSTNQINFTIALNLRIAANRRFWRNVRVAAVGCTRRDASFTWFCAKLNSNIFPTHFTVIRLIAKSFLWAITKRTPSLHCTISNNILFEYIVFEWVSPPSN